jgi:glycosyltransferase involved in cell wall biosynthesis
MKLGIDKNFFKLADHVIFVSDATRKIYSDLEYDNNFETIPNGLVLEEIESFKLQNNKNELRAQYGFSSSDEIITIVGTVTERKGQLNFVEAAIHILDSCKYDNLKFLVVGARESDYLNRIKEKINQTKFSSSIHLVPETGKVYDYYLISDIFVCASFIESFPRVTLEAMAFQLPIIATNVYGIPEQIKDGIDGILIEPGNSMRLAEKIEFLLDNPTIALQYASAANKKVKKQYGINKIIPIYNQIMEKYDRRKAVLAQH